MPFRHGPIDVVKYSATPSPDNPARPLQRKNPNGLQDELIRHVQEDSKMSSFDFGVQFLDAGRMTYWGKRRDANFWIENASVEWNEAEAPFHTVARLTSCRSRTFSRMPRSSLFRCHRALDTGQHARWEHQSRPLAAEVASRKARMHADSSRESERKGGEAA